MKSNIAPITEQPIDLLGLLAQAHHPKAGAIVLFSGEVRNHHDGKGVQYLSYECYVPMAEKMIRQILTDALAKYELHYVLCQHRIGKVAIGESAVVVITGASHRQEAYTANRYIIDRVKYEVPIWKREYFEDGEVVWAHNSGKQEFGDE